MDYDFYKAGADFIKEKIGYEVDTAIILGTALGGFANQIKNPVVIDYKEIPNFLESTNEDHAGKMIIGEICGKKVLCMSGRFHYYEGYSFNELAISIRILSILGVKNLIITNAAGAVNKKYNVGDLMIIEDHLNFMGISPTRGKNVSEFGRRFFDMSNAYDKKLIKIAEKCKKKTNLKVRKGVYVFASGPQFETTAEIKFMRIAGANAVGMSTVPEVIAAAQCKIRVLGISLITNMAAGINKGPIDGKEVNIAGEQSKGGFKKYIKAILKKI